MKIAKMELTNFRCFDYFEAQFDPHLTVLIARNGTGKSTLLDAIALSLGAFITRLPNVKGLSFKKTDFRLNHKGSSPPFMRIRCESTNGIIWDRTERRDQSKRTLCAIPPGVGLKELHEYVDKYIDAHNAGEDYTLPIFIYYGTGRAVFDIPLRKRDFCKPFSRFSAFEGALESRTNYKRFVHYFYQLEEREARLQKEARSFDVVLPELQSIRSIIHQLLPEVSNIRSVEPAGIMIDWTADIEEKTITKSFRIEQLSDGYRTSLAMVMDIASRIVEANPQSISPVETEGVILIDEIDLHLHPDWQREFLPRLITIFPNIQFIVSTHSPFILQSVKQGLLIDLDKEDITESSSLDQEMSIEDIAEDIMGMENIQRSALFNEQVEISDQYYQLLKEGFSECDPDVQCLAQRLDEIEAQFSDNPVWVALMRAERRKSEES